MTPAVGAFAYSASAVASWAAFSRRGKAVLGPHHDGLVAQTPGLRPESKLALPAGLGLAFAILILSWTLMFLALGALAACGIIRTI
jgi:hypothetical protein